MAVPTPAPASTCTTRPASSPSPSPAPPTPSSSLPTSSVIFLSHDSSVVLLDIPRSLEESQLPPVDPGQQPDSHGETGAAGVGVGAGLVTPLRSHHHQPRLYSADPPARPFPTPEPKHGAGAHGHASQSHAAQLADLMMAATVNAALEHLRSHHQGPLHLPRMPPPSPEQDRGHSSLPIPLPPVIPRHADYLQGSIQATRQAFLDTAPIFDLIVLDPPWPNRSARRRTAGYATASTLAEMRQLLTAIPVSSHLSANGLVAVWITNKPSIVDFLTSAAADGGLFAAWGVELVTEWTWVKIAASGEPLYDVDSAWRKPWEKLLIAKRVGSSTPPELKPKTIFACPDLHSRKPSLRALFQDALGREYKGLEVFARNLTAGWWSWGNEVLRFQEPQYWARPVDQS